MRSKKSLVLVACTGAVLLLFAGGPLFAQSVRLSLEEAIALGLENSTGIASKRSALAAAQEDLKAAKAGYYPSLSAGLSYTHLFEQPTQEFLGTTFVVGPSNPVGLSVDLSQTITTFGKTRNGVKIAEEGVAQAGLALEEEKRKLIVQIKNAFYGYLLAVEVKAINQQTFEAKQNALEVAQARYDAGMVADFEVLRAESDLESFRSTVISSNNSVRVALLNVQNALGIEGEGVDVELVGELEKIPVETDRDRLIALALSSRYDILSFRKNIDILEARDRLNRSLRLPTLVGWANYQLASGIDDNGDDAYFQADAWDGTLSAGLQLSIPVSVWFPWSKEASTNRKSQIQLQDLELQYQSVVSGVRLAVESSILKIAEEEAKIASGTKSVELAQRLYDSAVEQYESGYISSTDLRDAQLSLNGARLGYAQAIYGYNGNVLALMDAVGVSSF